MKPLDIVKSLFTRNPDSKVSPIANIDLSKMPETVIAGIHAAGSELEKMKKGNIKVKARIYSLSDANMSTKVGTEQVNIGADAGKSKEHVAELDIEANKFE
jgi:hypothetical protein